jgi:hypothetical protein
MSTPVNFAKAKELTIKYMSAKIVPFLRGSPGCGKSAMMQEIADEFNLFLIDHRLSTSEPSDLSGLISSKSGTDLATYKALDIFPLESTPLPINPKSGLPYSGFLLFLDEFNSAGLAVQKACYKLILDRAIGQHKLHKNVAIVCAGNLDTDNALTSKLSTAMQSRLAHITITKDGHADWLQWAATAHVDYRITSFINFKPEALNAFKPDHVDPTFACQRTWEFANRLIKNEPNLNFKDHAALLSGVISEGMAHEFIGFTQVFNQLPDINDIIRNPHSAKLPNDPSTTYAVTGLLANHADSINAQSIITYAGRLPAEFTMLTMTDACRRNPKFIHNEHVQEWIGKNLDLAP